MKQFRQAKNQRKLSLWCFILIRILHYFSNGYLTAKSSKKLTIDGLLKIQFLKDCWETNNLHFSFIAITTYGGASVTDQAKIVPALVSQRWERNKSYKQGWFTLRNPNSGLFLKGYSTLPTPIIEGNNDKQIWLSLSQQNFFIAY